MSMFPLSEGEKWVQCPYNRAHMITDVKFLIHLEKCRRNHEKEMFSQGKKVEFAICRYNTLLQVHKVELDYHHQTCRDQYKIVEHLKCRRADPSTSSLGKRKRLSTHEDDDNDDKGGWDATLEEDKKLKPYQSVKLREDGILFIPPGLTKAKRKAYQKEQMKKLQQQEEEGDEEEEYEDDEEYEDGDEGEYEEEEIEEEKKVKNPHLLQDGFIKKELKD